MEPNDHFKFPSGWWLTSPAVRSLDPAVRDFCVTLMCFMSKGNPAGTLTTESGKPLTPKGLVSMVSVTEEDARRMVAQLIDTGALSREPHSHIIYDPRQVKQRELSEMKRKAGQQGGNVMLARFYNEPGKVYAVRRSSDRWVKIGASKNPPGRLSGIRSQYPGNELTLLLTVDVDDMGTAEAFLHERFSVRPRKGEWFGLNDDDVTLIPELIRTELPGHLAGQKPRPTPKQSAGLHHLPDGWELSPAEYGNVKALAATLWPEVRGVELDRKLGGIIVEFRNYWLEMARLDRENGTKKALKTSWYLTLVSRVKDVHDRESRGQAAVRLRADAAAPVYAPEERPAARRAVSCVTCQAAREDAGLPPCPFHTREEGENGR